jgi:hypothetical protein
MTTSNNMLNCLVPVPRGRPRFHAVSITSYHYTRNHGNLDIIVIPETRSVSLFTLNNPHKKRAQARAR